MLVKLGEAVTSVKSSHFVNIPFAAFQASDQQSTSGKVVTISQNDSTVAIINAVSIDLFLDPRKWRSG